MKKLLFIFLSVPVWAAGPKYGYKDPRLNDEMNNIYMGLDKHPQFVELYSYTKVQFATLTPRRVGAVFYCSDCTTDVVCAATGTATGAWSRISARTTACQ